MANPIIFLNEDAKKQHDGRGVKANGFSDRESTSAHKNTPSADPEISKVRTFREISGLSRDEVCQKTGIEKMVYLMLEEGDFSPLDLSVRQAYRLSQVIGIPPECLFKE